jgi:hypothetical protein
MLKFATGNESMREIIRVLIDSQSGVSQSNWEKPENKEGVRHTPSLFLISFRERCPKSLSE